MFSLAAEFHFNNWKKNTSNATLNLSSNLIESFNDETNFLHKSLLTNTQVSKIHKAFANVSSDNLKFSKTLLSIIVQLGRFMFCPGNIFGPPIIAEIISLANPITNSFVKELSNTCTRKLNSNFIVDSRLKIIGKKIKKGISPITSLVITTTNNERKNVITVISL